MSNEQAQQGAGFGAEVAKQAVNVAWPNLASRPAAAAPAGWVTNDIDQALHWLDSALRCDKFEWDGDQMELAREAHTRATSALIALHRAALTGAAQGAEPVATLHDDGYYTFKPGKEPNGARYAGWRMDVFAASPQPPTGTEK